MKHFVLPNPAIIQPVVHERAYFGRSYAISRVEYDEFWLPTGWREALSFDELRNYFPIEEPDWILKSMLPHSIPVWRHAKRKTATILATTSASNQTWNVLGEWASSDNRIDVIAAGGAGGGSTSSNAGSGGGGAGWSRTTNLSLTAGGTASYTCPPSVSGGSGVSGGTGLDAWFNNTVLGNPVGAKGGGGGQTGGSAGTGGASASGFGSSKTSGGNGQIRSGSTSGGGGGGAGGPGGNGAAGAANAGGAAGGGSGGTGGPIATAGGAGSDITSTPLPTSGSGGGGGGRTSSGNGGQGGNYGGGGGGSVGNGLSGGQGRQGVIVIVNNLSL